MFKNILKIIIISVLVGISSAATAVTIEKQGSVGITAEVPVLEPIISNLKIESVGTTTAVISFDTNVPTKATIYYGTTSGYGFLLYDENFTTHHVFYLSALFPDTLYHFNIIAEDSGGRTVETGDNTFHTLPLAPEQFTPEVYNITETTASIRWQTSKTMKCVIYYGLTTEYNLVYEEDDYKLIHDVDLTDLDPSALYHFKINCVDRNNVSVESADDTFTTLTPGVPVVIIEPAKNILEETANSIIYQILLALLTLLAFISTLASILIPAIANLPLLSLLDQIFSFFIFAGKKKWGIVYDSKSKQGVPKAKVKLYDFETKKLLAESTTDKAGHYGFSIAPGKYYLVVEKTDYKYPSGEIKIDYHKEVIEVKKDTQPIINIPVDAKDVTVNNRLEALSRLDKFFNAIRLPVMAIGTAIALVFYIAYPVTFNMLVLGFYGVMWTWEFYQAAQTFSLGNIFNAENKELLGNTTIRIYDKISGKLVATKLSDANGHYTLSVKPGDYEITADHKGYKSSELKDVHLAKGKVVSEKIFLKKIN